MPQNDRVIGLHTKTHPWGGVVPPFRMLDPELTRAADLPLFTDITSSLPDEAAATMLLNAACHIPQLYTADEEWHLALDAPLALAILVVTDHGWRRFKQCAVCGSPFLDRTAAATRLRCDAHVRTIRRPG